MSATLPSPQGPRRSPEAFAAELAGELGIAGKLGYVDWLRRAAQGREAATAMVFRGRRWSYRELYEAVDDAACWLSHEAGLQPGDRVAMLLDNGDEYQVWYLGILAAGLLAVPLNNKLVPREIAYQLQDSGARLLIAESRFQERVDEAQRANGVRLPQVTIDRDAFPAGARRHGLPPSPDVHAPCAVYYTSGTTGAPKGVVHTHFSLIAHAYQARRSWEFDSPETVFLAMTPMFHIANHTMFLPVFSVGGRLVVDAFKTDQVFATVEREGVNVLFAVPSMLLLMLQSPARPEAGLPGVRVVQFGAAPMAMERLAEVQRMFPNASLNHGMGQTESGGTICTLPGARAFEKIGSIGTAIDGCEARIVDDLDRELPRGTVGELIARGPHVMRAYLNKPEQSAETLKGGWLHTGDLGWMDEEGCVYLVDRKKDMIIRGGENIYSSEVEGVIYGHPAVSLCAVVGKPSHVWGEEVLAYILPKDPAARFDVAELEALCRRELAAYKVPAEFRVVERFPLTATGKIQKQELKRQLRGG